MLDFYKPMPHQRTFHAAESTRSELALLAGNRTGKTMCGGAAVAIHTTGRYPKWWTGRRFLGPTDWWVAGKSIEATRDVPQSMLLGKDLDEHLGTGMLPKTSIGKVTRKQIPDAADRVLVKHISGGWSRISFKSFDQDVTRWRGAKLHGLWFDEEPPAEIYSEGLARLTDLNGLAYLTLTPLEGMTKVVAYFYPEPTSPQRALIRAEIETCGLYSRSYVQRHIAKYPAHEREARSKGIPMLGSGPIFPVAESTIVVPPYEIPKSWGFLLAVDFGWEHPTSCVKVAYDRASDKMVVCGEYRQNEESIVVHAKAMRVLGGDRLPVVWPHDGWSHQGGKSDQTTADLYRHEGVRMWPTHATFADGGFGTDAAIQALLDRMRTGRFQVFATCPLWLEEFRMYHRKDGKIVKERDDLLSATMKAVMMLRVARPDEVSKRRPAPSIPEGRWDPFGQLGGKMWG